MSMDDIDRTKRFLRTNGQFVPDQFFMDLDHILMPLSCQPFEKFGILIAAKIAKKYGASITALHVGNKNVNSYMSTFDDYKVKYDIIQEDKSKNIANTILDLAQNGFQLVIMPSRRRLRWIDKFLTNSISAKTIPYIDYDVLQVFPAKGPITDDNLPDFSSIGLLLKRTHRDDKLIFWTNAFLTMRTATVTAYHIADLPSITPYAGALSSNVIKKEKEKFEDRISGYSQIFGVNIQPRFILSHRVGTTAAKNLNPVPDQIVIMGQTKVKKWYHIRSLSDKIIDWTKNPLIVHHQPLNK